MSRTVLSTRKSLDGFEESEGSQGTLGCWQNWRPCGLLWEPSPKFAVDANSCILVQMLIPLITSFIPMV